MLGRCAVTTAGRVAVQIDSQPVSIPSLRFVSPMFEPFSDVRVYEYTSTTVVSYSAFISYINTTHHAPLHASVLGITGKSGEFGLVENV